MIIIEGIIGAGKTTLAEKIHKTIPGSKLYLEPVEGNPYLERFYRDKKRWALEMQYYLMAKRFEMHRDAVEFEWRTGNTTIFDRSIYGDGAFAKMLHDDGYIDKLGYNCYKQHRQCMEKYLLIPQQVIFLDIDIDTTMERINKRGRECEGTLPRDYQVALREAYDIIINYLKIHTTVNVVRDDSEIETILLEYHPPYTIDINILNRLENGDPFLSAHEVFSPFLHLYREDEIKDYFRKVSDYAKLINPNSGVGEPLLFLKEFCLAKSKDATKRCSFLWEKIHEY